MGESQSGLWVLGQTDPIALRAYHESTTLDLRGPLQVEALQRAIQRVVNRHEALRTTVDPSGETQTIHATLPVDFSLVDLAGCSPEERASELAAALQEAENAPFDFEHGPIFRARLVRLADEHHLLTLTFHHLLGNGPSYWVFLEDLADFVAAEHAGQPVTLASALQLSAYLDWREQQARKLRGRGRSLLARRVRRRGAYAGASRRPPASGPPLAPWRAASFDART